jgi:hypothetical protein
LFGRFTREDLLHESSRLSQKPPLTKAGRALQKHSDEGSAFFTKPSGILNPATYNRAGVAYVRGILDDPAARVVRYRHKIYGEIVDIRLPSRHGLRFRANGTFMGFLDP